MASNPFTTRRIGVAAGVVVIAASAATVGTLSVTSESSPPAAQAQAPDDDSDTRTITVSGEATVDVKPDTAVVSLGVLAGADRADAALDGASQKATQLIDSLKASGVAPDDIQTSNLSVWRRGKDKGWVSTNDVTVRTTDLANLGTVIDAASDAVGDGFTMDGVQFSFDDPESVLGDVRADAVADARRKADQFVSGEDITVGEIQQLNEGSPNDVYYGEESLAAADMAAPIEAGSQELSVKVSVKFLIG